MKFIDEYRDRTLIEHYLRAISRRASGTWTIMEVCGGQTHAILKHGIDRRLPHTIRLIHGPGCPVCVTPNETIDQAIEIALRPEVVFCTFGDMLRVPGGLTDLMTARARGADIRMVYSPLEAVSLARANPGRQVVFFAIGFETTVPVVATAVMQAAAEQRRNFTILAAQVRIPAAMTVILGTQPRTVDAFLAPGHVCTVTGAGEYADIVGKYRVPIVITGFEPVDLLQGIYMAVKQLEHGKAELQNQYARAVRADGNRLAKQRMERAFQPTDRQWRGLGLIPASGLALREEYADFDAVRRFAPATRASNTNDTCCGQVLSGAMKPPACPDFGSRCSPDTPIGPCMVSSEGACAAYYRYRECQV
ncbi:MAG: hydrogenase formation protein HypD [Candidatus Zixiibacteriota bacterium]